MATSKSDPSSRLSQFKESVKTLGNETAGFWLKYGIDREKGGFYGALRSDASPVREAPKQLSQQARHLWFLSAYARLRQSSEAKKEAQKLFEFINTKFKLNNGEYALSIQADGQKIVSSKRKLWLYMHSFLIFSYAEFYKLTQNDLALSEALAVLKGLPHDSEHGGYDQSAEERWYAGVKETNSHMHAMEALMNLYEALPDVRSGDRNFVRGRLKELYEIFMKKITRDGFAYHDSFDKQWTPVGSGWVNFGHDFEIVHLLLKARKNLGVNDSASLEHIKNLGRRAVKFGYDSANGGSFYKGELDGRISDRSKIWWAQCEQLLAFYRLNELDPRLVSLDQIERTFKWIRDQHLSKERKGAWFATPGNQGSLEWNTHLSSEWFASYHTMRALLEIAP